MSRYGTDYLEWIASASEQSDMTDAQWKDIFEYCEKVLYANQWTDALAENISRNAG